MSWKIDFFLLDHLNNVIIRKMMNKVLDKKGKKIHHLLGHLNNMTIRKMINKTMNKKMINKTMSKVICKKKTQQNKKATIAILAIAIV